MRRETKRRKAEPLRRSSVQGLQDGSAAFRWAHSCEFLPFLQLLNSFLGSCTNVFSGIGVELGDRSLFRCLLDIVDVIPNDLLRLRVVDHH
jgi:hypothetical protein